MTIEQIRELVQSSEQVTESEQTFQKSDFLKGSISLLLPYCRQIYLTYLFPLGYML